MTKTLLTLGDSWTDSEYPGYAPNGVVTWAEQVIEKMEGWKLVNLAKEASGNEKIMKIGVDYLRDNTPDAICVLWSEQHREDFYNRHNLMPISAIYNKSCDPKSKEIYNIEAVYDSLVNTNLHLNVPREYFRNLYILQSFADMKGIPIYHGQGTKLWSKWIYNKVGKKVGNRLWREWLTAFIECEYFEMFDKDHKNFVGWPMQKGITKHGFAFTERMDGRHRISGDDPHPNTKGHEMIAYEFLKKLKAKETIVNA